MSIVKLKDLNQGDVIEFAGYSWYVLEPSTGYLWMKGDIGKRKFASTRTERIFVLGNSGNIGHYLNSVWLPTLPPEAQEMIKSHNWSFSSYRNESGIKNPSATNVQYVNAKVGLIGAREWKKYSKRTNPDGNSFAFYDTEEGFVPNFTEDAWTRDRNGDGEWSPMYVIDRGLLINAYSDSKELLVVPAIYLDIETEIADGKVYLPTSVTILDENKEVIKSELSLNDLPKGDSSTVPLFLKNDSDEVVSEIVVKFNDCNFPPFSTVELSLDIDFMVTGRYLVFKDLQPYEERPFYLKVKSHLESKSGSGHFDIVILE